MARLSATDSIRQRFREGDHVARIKPGGPNVNTSIVGYITWVRHTVSEATFMGACGHRFFRDDFRLLTTAESIAFNNAQKNGKPVNFTYDLKILGEPIVKEDLEKKDHNGKLLIGRGTVVVRIARGSSSARQDQEGYIAKIMNISSNGNFSDMHGNSSHIKYFRLADGAESHKFNTATRKIFNIDTFKDSSYVDDYFSSTRGSLGRNFITQAKNSPLDKELAAMMAMKVRMQEEEMERADLLRNNPSTRTMEEQMILQQSRGAVMSHHNQVSDIRNRVNEGIRHDDSKTETKKRLLKVKRKTERTLPPPVVISLKGKGKKIKRLI